MPQASVVELQYDGAREGFYCNGDLTSWCRWVCSECWPAASDVFPDNTSCASAGLCAPPGAAKNRGDGAPDQSVAVKQAWGCATRWRHRVAAPFAWAWWPAPPGVALSAWDWKSTADSHYLLLADNLVALSLILSYFYIINWWCFKLQFYTTGFHVIAAGIKKLVSRFHT